MDIIMDILIISLFILFLIAIYEIRTPLKLSPS